MSKKVTGEPVVLQQMEKISVLEDHFDTTSTDFAISEELKQISEKINPNDFKTLKVLGRGMFGKVVLVQHLITGKLYALKTLKKAKIIKLLQVEHTQSERKYNICLL